MKQYVGNEPSLPAWGVRVEIGAPFITPELLKSLPAWGVRVEINLVAIVLPLSKSLPAWGVRVEICR